MPTFVHFDLTFTRRPESDVKRHLEDLPIYEEGGLWWQMKTHTMDVELRRLLVICINKVFRNRNKTKSGFYRKSFFGKGWWSRQVSKSESKWECLGYISR